MSFLGAQENADENDLSTHKRKHYTLDLKGETNLREVSRLRHIKNKGV